MIIIENKIIIQNFKYLIKENLVLNIWFLIIKKKINSSTCIKVINNDAMKKVYLIKIVA